MRILLAQCFRPFESRPSDILALDLVRKIQETGHQCELVRIPETEPENLNLLMKTLEIENADCLVSLDFPSHGIRHKTKILVQLDPESGENLGDLLKLDQPSVKWIFIPMDVRHGRGPCARDGVGKSYEYINIEELAHWVVRERV